VAAPDNMFVVQCRLLFCVHMRLFPYDQHDRAMLCLLFAPVLFFSCSLCYVLFVWVVSVFFFVVVFLFCFVSLVFLCFVCRWVSYGVSFVFRLYFRKFLCVQLCWVGLWLCLFFVFVCLGSCIFLF